MAAAGLAASMLSACASEPVERPVLSGSPEARQGEVSPEDAGPTRPPGMRPLFISPAGQPFHGQPDGPAPVTLWFAQADADHDGKLNREELTQDFERFFKLLDANADGAIDGFESQAYERSIAPELLPRVGRLREGEGQDSRLFKGGGRGDGMDRSGGGRRGRERSGGGPNPAVVGGGQSAGSYQFFPDLEPITAADSDLDGKVTLAEWRLRARAVFHQLDDKNTGALTLPALPKTPQQRAIERRKAADDNRRSR